jgi:hypothetical protein
MEQAYKVARLLRSEIEVSFVAKEVKNSWMLDFYDLDSRVGELEECLSDFIRVQPQCFGSGRIRAFATLSFHHKRNAN